MTESLALQIENAQLEDLPAVLRLYAQPELDDGKTLPLEEARRIYERIRSYPDYYLYVARREGKIVGTFALLIMDNLGHLGAPSGVVEDVAVDPECQGQGIGKAMMTFAMQRCRDAGCYKLALSSNIARSKAHEFYKSLGFRQHGLSFVTTISGD